MSIIRQMTYLNTWALTKKALLSEEPLWAPTFTPSGLSTLVLSRAQREYSQYHSTGWLGRLGGNCNAEQGG